MQLHLCGRTHKVQSQTNSIDFWILIRTQFVRTIPLLFQIANFQLIRQMNSVHCPLDTLEHCNRFFFILFSLCLFLVVFSHMDLRGLRWAADCYGQLRNDRRWILFLYLLYLYLCLSSMSVCIKRISMSKIIVCIVLLLSKTDWLRCLHIISDGRCISTFILFIYLV